MKHLVKIMLVLLMAGLGAAMTSGCSAKPEEIPVEKPVVKNTIEAFGIVKSAQDQAIYLDIPGTITEVLVKEGQVIKKGDTLLLLDFSNYEEQIRLKENEAKIIGLEKTKLERTSYKKQLDAERLKFKDTEALYGSGGISKSDYDQAKLDLDTKEDQYLSVLKEAEIKDVQKASIQTSINEMKKKLNKSYLNGNKLISPFDSGVAYEIAYKSGEALDPSRKLLSIADLSHVVVEAEITEEFIGGVKVGSAVTVIPVADRTKVFSGKISRIASIAKVKNGETIVPVEVEIENTDGFLKPNFNVDVSIAK